MNQQLLADIPSTEQTSNPGSASALGRAFLDALFAKDFETVEKFFQPSMRFRAMVPSGERMGSNPAEALKWLRKWFGNNDALIVLDSSAGPVFDRLYLHYRLSTHDDQDGWQLVEQHAYCVVKDGLIADMWLVCSGFRDDPAHPKASAATQSAAPSPHLGGDQFYDAGARGCAEGPLDEIAARMRGLAPGGTLEIHASDPSVAADLPAWCRLSGNELIRHEGEYFLVRRK